MIDVVVDALDQSGDFPQLLLLQPTSPLRTSAHIDDFISLWRKSGLPSGVSVGPARHHPAWTFHVESNNKLGRSFVPHEAHNRQELSPAFTLNGAMFAGDSAWLRNSGTFLSEETYAYQMSVESSLDIDEPIDLALASLILSGVLSG